MALQSSGSITARDIAIELGYTQGAETKIGDYRLNGGQDFTGVKLPVSEGVPTSGPIKFSDFYEARRTFVVDYFSKDENRPQDAYDRFVGVGNTVAIGGFSTLDANAGTSGQRVIILVNKDITSSKGNVNNCALRTGTGWDPDTVLEINVGPDGEVLGAGGDGGRGGESDRGNGFVGGDGSSAIGIQHEGTGGTKVTIQSGGRVAAGGGGGGGGGGAFVEREERWGGPRRYAGGSGGGGGVGSPAGLGGGGGGDGGRAGTSGSKTTSGVGGAFNQNPTQGGEYVARGGKGGDGGGISGTSVNDGIDGVDGLGYGRIEGSPRHTGGKGAGGDAGAAIRRNVGLTVVIQNLGPPSQLLGSTSATGIA